MDLVLHRIISAIPDADLGTTSLTDFTTIPLDLERISLDGGTTFLPSEEQPSYQAAVFVMKIGALTGSGEVSVGIAFERATGPNGAAQWGSPSLLRRATGTAGSHRLFVWPFQALPDVFRVRFSVLRTGVASAILFGKYLLCNPRNDQAEILDGVNWNYNA